MSLGLFVSSLPWWLAAPLLQIAVLVVGMALDETYVNRTTILTGAIAAHMHIFVAGDAGFLVALYADVGLVIGAYGLYAYVIDGYVGAWFRLLAYFVYSPLAVFLVILTAGPTLFGVEPLVVPAIVLAGYANHQLREYLSPREPYYFGPDSPDAFEASLETGATAGSPIDAPTAETGDSAAESATTASENEPTAAATADDATARSGGGPESGRPEANSFDESGVREGGTEFDHPGAEPAAAADSSERGILPEFMRRL
ncbi:hypothetical protein [Natronorubrum texcoconense]|uniref:Uncharacterized protein n=1 Tax=Natronorubrum texcoconense TaxID=1095776 RepID=A0A1G9FYM2_9EURY|nr:hypothetical protein [Natronorubrum texcoconense]SDK93437.1 hypothetical protein SAMN04515672_4344 [Natronorubrum texcoconense]